MTIVHYLHLIPFIIAKKTVKTPLQLSVPIADPVEGDLSEETSIGIGGEFHCIVGGHFYIGWDPSEFMRIMREE